MVLDAMTGYGAKNEISTAGEASFLVQSLPSDGFPKVNNYESLAKSGLSNDLSVTWKTEADSCGTMWTVAYGCEGIAEPW
jgi:hypothetical protein